jgi:hypothetical protein
MHGVIVAYIQEHSDNSQEEENWVCCL